MSAGRDLAAARVLTWPRGLTAFLYAVCVLDAFVLTSSERGIQGSEASPQAAQVRSVDIRRRIDALRGQLREEHRSILDAIEFDGECGYKVGSGELSPYLELSCGLPAALALEVFFIAWEHRSACAAASNYGRCGAAAVSEELAVVREQYLERLAVANGGWQPLEAVNAKMKSLLESHVERVASTLQGLEVSLGDNVEAMFNAILMAALQLGMARRVLQWQMNQVESIVEFGLQGYIDRVELSTEFADSRMQVLMALLGGPPAAGLSFAEIGVHLARLSFAMMSELPGLRYVGVDPFSYGTDTSAASVAVQLNDLGLRQNDELQEVREGAEHKFRLFGERAQLLPVTSVEGARSFPDGTFHGVFIDGDHSYQAVVDDVAAWEPKVRPGGFLSGHDFGHNRDVARAVLEHAARADRTVYLAMDWVWYWHLPP
eukprot:TRINITY_DN32686_c0_g1_i1.p1 TRINITY_DN32686_c0_g1~~TRINITY_DN32686_c0_g1_i1.p1  ORF type:complete len:431 (+),score=74.93 TRINITY_DN32686_c0_g1_i1:62-1354(+)